MQPTFLPWLGYFDLIDQSDIFVFYNDVQLAKRSWQVRNRIKTANGELYLTVPIKKTTLRDDTLIVDAKISYEEQWQKKIIQSLSGNYSKAPFYKVVFNMICEIISENKNSLSELNTAIIINYSKAIGIKTEFIFSSDLEGINGTKDTRLVNICKSLNATNYLSPQGSSTYIEAIKPGGEFPENNIQLFYQHYIHPVYQQLHGDFLPYMSILDLLFNYGFDDALHIIQSGRNKNYSFMEYRNRFMIHNS